MLVNIPQTLYVTGNYYQGRYGEVDLSVNDRLDIPDQCRSAWRGRHRVAGPQRPQPYPVGRWQHDSKPARAPYIGEDNTLRAGDTIPSTDGCLTLRLWCLRTAPDGSGELHPRQRPRRHARRTSAVRSRSPASMSSTTSPPSIRARRSAGRRRYGLPWRGYGGRVHPPARQDHCRDLAMDADVIGLMEMENHPTDAALQTW